MRAHVLLVLTVVGVGPGAAVAACPPELLGRLLDQGYSKEEVLRLCGDGESADGGLQPSPEASSALGRLRQLTSALKDQCQSTMASNPRGTGACDLYLQYRDILVEWQRGQDKCSAGDEAACKVLDEAADAFLKKLPATPPS